MKVLVLGGTRFVGPLLVARLVARGDRVTLFNRGNHDPFGAHPITSSLERIVGDRATDLDRVQGMFDAIVDLSAYEALDVERAISTFSGRVGRYLFVSTGQVYLVRAGLAPPYRESDYHGPLMPCPPGEEEGYRYGVGKRTCEDLLVARTAFPSTRLRIPVVHGPRDYARRIERLLLRILDGGPLLHAEPDRRIRHVDADEVARTIVALVSDPRAEGEVYNQTHDETPTLRELVAMIGAEVGASPRVLATPNDALRAAGIDPHEAFPFVGPMSFLDPAKLRALGVGHAPLQRTITKVVAELLARWPSPPEGHAEHREKELAFAKAIVS